MSMTAARQYARTRMKALGYTEWTDGFFFQDIPKTILDRTFFLEQGQAVGVQNNQDYQQIEVPITVRFFGSPTGKTVQLIDEMTADADAAVSDFLAAANRTLFSGLKNVKLTSVVVQALATENNNGAIVKMDFKMLVMISTR